jgi:LEA14-like dessication related protein
MRAALAMTLAAAAALGAGCAALAPKLLPPTVAVEGVRVTRLQPGDTRLRVVLDVDNPNAQALLVSALDVALKVEGEPLATAILPAPVTLAATAATKVEIEARTGFVALAAVAERVSRGHRARYEVSGTAVVGDGVALPFTRRGELPLGDLLGKAP